MPSWIVTWRFLLSYVGGVGMILMGMIVLPILRIGGMQLFRTEYSDRNEKILPSVAQIATWIVGVYSGLIAISAVLLRLSGLSLRDSVCYAISTVSTSGIPTYSNSLMSLNNVWSEVIILVGMILGGSSLLLFIKGLKGNFGAVKKDIQLKGYLETLLAFSLITTWLRWYNSDLSLFNSVREGALSAVSFITTTGAFNSDYEKWGPFAMLLFPIMSLVGGCTGSTSGGIKIFRFQILFTCAKAHIQQLRCPHGVFIPVYNGQKVTDTVAFSVFVFIALYIITICSASLLLALCGFDFETSVSAAIATVGNVGAGIGSLVGTGGAPCSVAVGAKMVLIVCMILGRLELLTLLTLLLPSFWRK
jgi:trk system potassium uptake protein TrkH